MKTSPVIYIAGPLSGDTPETIAANIAVADDLTYRLVQKCHQRGLAVRVLVPHNNTGIWLLSHPVASEKQRELYMAECLDWVRQADLLVYITDSPGALNERDEAVSYGVPVYNLRTWTLDAVVNWVVEWYQEKPGQEPSPGWTAVKDQATCQACLDPTCDMRRPQCPWPEKEAQQNAGQHRKTA